ncbi:MAG: sulfotransferase domain-containing protein [Pseudomonadota bacterium]
MSTPQSDRRIIWLASFPKSGNTWIRSLLAQYFHPKGTAPDINTLRRFTTGDMRVDWYAHATGRNPFVAKGFEDYLQARAVTMRAIARSKPGVHFVKTHCQVRKIGDVHLIPPSCTAGAVYMIRNPFDVAQSYARHLDISTAEVVEVMADRKAMNRSKAYLVEVIGRWDEHIASWTGVKGLRCHVVRYEDMIADATATIRTLLGFLEQKIDEGQLAHAVAETSFEKLRREEAEKGFIERPGHMKAFFAKGQVGSWRDELTGRDVASLRAAFLPTLERWYPDLAAETAGIGGTV